MKLISALTITLLAQASEIAPKASICKAKNEDSGVEMSLTLRSWEGRTPEDNSVNVLAGSVTG